jgi:hypothetical protein
METSVKDNVEAQKLHNAGYAFISSLVHHVPYMISGGYLDKLLSISNASAEADLDDEADESRVQCLQLAAKQIDAKSLFGALEKNWEEAAAAGVLVRSSTYSFSLIFWFQSTNNYRLFANIWKSSTLPLKNILGALSPNTHRFWPRYSRMHLIFADSGWLQQRIICPPRQ